MNELEEVKAARRAGDWQRALELTLAAWHRTKHPTLAEVVEAFSKEALVTFSSPKTKVHEDFQRAWLEVARERDDVATGWLAQTLTLRVPKSARVMMNDLSAEERYPAWFERLAALGSRVADPRVASALCAELEAPTFTRMYDPARTWPIYTQISELISAQGDVRCVKRLEALQSPPADATATVRRIASELIGPLLITLSRVVVEPLENEDEWRAQMPAPQVPIAPDASEGDLLEAVYAHPADDSVRAVYADALLARGDPLGEFVSLQLLREPNEKQTKRANSLLRSHRATWLGPLASVLKWQRFARGFLVSAELEANASAPEATWELAAQDPRLSTVEVLEQGYSNIRHLTAFLSSGALRNLKRLELPSYTLAELLGRSPFLESVEHLLAPGRGSLKQLAKIGAFKSKALKRLTTPVEAGDSAQWLAALISSTLIERIEHYEVVPANGRPAHPLVAEIFAKWPELTHAQSLAVATEPSYREPAPRVLLERIGASLKLTFHVALEAEGTKLISTLPASLREVHVVRSGKWVLRDETAVKASAAKRSVALHIHTA